MVQVEAREVFGEEHERLWRLVSGEFSLYPSYQQRTERSIPLFVFEPIFDG